MTSETMATIKKAITKNHTGKMEGVQSLSTCCKCSELCNIRHNTDDDLIICKHCYSFRMLERYKTLEKKLIRNTEFLTSTDIQADEVPFINTGLFRFEAFGELINPLQVKNYFTIARKNQHCTFALWTKNPFIIEDAMNLYKIKKPSNMIIIYSEIKINTLWTRAKLEAFKKRYPFIDKVFTVHNKSGEIYNYHSDLINCGAKKCADCRICYSKNDIDIIYEVLK